MCVESDLHLLFIYLSIYHVEVEHEANTSMTAQHMAVISDRNEIMCLLTDGLIKFLYCLNFKIMEKSERARD